MGVSGEVEMALYQPYRTVGLVTDQVPLVVNRMGEENFFIAAVGNSFQVFRSDRLQVVLVSKPAPGKITALAARGQETFVAVGNQVIQYRRTDPMATMFEMPSDVKGMLIVGDILVAYDTTNHVWLMNVKERSVMGRIEILHSAMITKVCHPATYLNKFVFGFEDGHLELWNVRTSRLIHVFSGHLPILEQAKANAIASLNTEKLSTAVTAMVQSPSCDVLGIGFGSGDIILLNLRLDVTLFHFRQQRAVTSLSFRCDAATEKAPFLISASTAGHIYTWQVGGGGEGTALSSRSKLASTLEFAHHASVTHVEFLRGEPVFVSSGEDNALRMFIYDSPDGSARQLRYRQGHAKPPSMIRYYGDVSAGAQWGNQVGAGATGVVSADSSGGMLFSRVEKHCHFDRFSQAALLKGNVLKGRHLPPCVAFDFNYVSGRPWGNLVTVHAGQDRAYVWKVEDKAVTKTVLRVPTSIQTSVAGRKLTATTVAVSNDGHYAVVGYSDGSIRRFNIQSGLSRGSFPASLDDPKKTSSIQAEQFGVALDGRHNGAIMGLYLDPTGASLVSVGADGQILFWHVINQVLVHRETCAGGGLTKLAAMADAGMIAVADVTGAVRVYDLTTRRLVRVFLGGHDASITDLVFTMDGRRLISGSMDSTLRVWDMATGRCLAWQRFDAPIVSLTLAPNGDLFVAKTGHRGVDICLDRSLTATVSISREPTEPLFVSGGGTLLLAERKMRIARRAAETADDGVDAISAEAPDAELSTSLGLSMSGRPKAFWTSICYMELLRRRNQRVAPVTKSVIPFFLPSFDAAGRSEEQLKATNVESRVQKLTMDEQRNALSKERTESRRRAGLSNEWFQTSNLGRLLSSLDVQDAAMWSIHAPAVLTHLLNLTPPQIDMEIRGLCAYEGSRIGLVALRSFIQCLAALTRDGRSYEVVQAVLYRTLLAHSAKIASSYSLLDDVKRLQANLDDGATRLQRLLFMAICLSKTALQLPVA